LLIPALIYILHKGNQLVAKLILLGLVLVGTWINYVIIYDNNQSAGLFAPQDIDIFRLWLNKPYTKIHSVALGIVLARVF
jgi:hypothetical protein